MFMSIHIYSIHKKWDTICLSLTQYMLCAVKKQGKKSKWQKKYDKENKTWNKSKSDENLPVHSSHLVIKPGEVGVPSENHPTFLWTSFY